MAAIKLSISVALGLLLASCGPPARDWTGEWTGEQADLVRGAPNDTIAKTLRQVRLTVRRDGTFTLVRGGIPASGDVLYGGNGLTLRFTKVLDQPMERQPPEVRQQYRDVRVEPEKDGSAELVDPSDFNREPVSLKRSQPPGP